MINKYQVRDTHALDAALIQGENLLRMTVVPDAPFNALSFKENTREFIRRQQKNNNVNFHN